MPLIDPTWPLKYLLGLKPGPHTHQSTSQIRNKTTVISAALSHINAHNAFINLSNFSVSDKDVIALCQELKNKSIQTISIDLSYNFDLTNQSVEALLTLPIQHIDLSGTQVDEFGVHRLLTSTTLTSLTIKYNRLKQLQTTDFSANTHLITLDMSSNYLSGKGILAIGSSPSLQTVNVSANQLQSTDMVVLAKASFKQLILRANRLQDSDMKPFIDNPNITLQSMDLSNNCITVKEMDRLQNVMPQLTFSTPPTAPASAQSTLDHYNGGFDRPRS